MRKWFMILLSLFLCLNFLVGCEKGETDKKTIPSKEKDAISSNVDDNQSEENEKPDENVTSIVGTWKYQGTMDCAYVFRDDGTGTYQYSGTDIPFTYTDDGNCVSILFEGSTAANQMEYSIHGEILSIEDSFGEIVEYKLSQKS